VNPRETSIDRAYYALSEDAVESALEIATTALATRQRDAELHLVKGWAARTINPPLANDAAAAAVAFAPDDAFVLTRAALLLCHTSAPQDLIQGLADRAGSHRPADFRLHPELAAVRVRLALLQGDVPATELASRAAARASGQGFPFSSLDEFRLTRRSRLAHIRGQRVEAKEQFKRIDRLDETRKRISRGDVEMAQRTAEAHVGADPTDPEWALLYAMTLARQHDPSARDAIVLAATLGFDDPAILVESGLLLASLGESATDELAHDYARHARQARRRLGMRPYKDNLTRLENYLVRVDDAHRRPPQHSGGIGGS
jgi:hypothetical protein